MITRLLFILSVAFPPIWGVGTSLRAQQFTKITTGHLVTTPSGSRSCNWVDINGDDYQDILITNGTAGGENNLLYLNMHDGTFMLLADTVCRDNSPSDGATCADYDNDGHIDIFVANWYGVDNLLYHNNGNGSFTRIDTGNVPNDGGYSETGAWGDWDGDGLLDLYVTNSDGNFKNFLYHNLGNGHFEKATAPLPATEQFRSRSANWIDYDLDGDQDLFVTSESNQRNQLYRNDGYPNFTKIMSGTMATSAYATLSASWADYDNDGDFDVVVANYNYGEQLFRQDAVGQFVEMTAPFGQDMGCSFGSSFCDYDNDGDQDLLITNALCSPYTQNFLYENLGNGTFARNMTEPISTDTLSSYGCAWGDYDNDGFMDLVVANWWNETQPNSLYHNNGNANHWLELKLQGTVSNYSAIGTIVRCKANIDGTPTWQMRDVSAQSGYCSQNSLVVHFGLGNASVIDSLVVTWPSGIVQHFTQIRPDKLYSLVENGTIHVVGVKEKVKDGIGLRIYPNPSQGRFSVDWEGNAKAVRILDMQGSVVQAQTLEGTGEQGRLTFDLKAAKGIYILVLTSENGTVHQQRFIVD